MSDDSLNFGDIVDAANKPHYTTAKEFRTQLPVGYVLQHYGTEFSIEGETLTAICPFHDDTEESFDVFGENLEFWGCYPCFGGVGGDVIDLIRNFESLTENETPAAIAVANDLVAEMNEVGYTGPTQGKVRVAMNINKASKFVTRAYDRTNLELLNAFCQLKGFTFSAQYLHEQFGVGTWDDWIVIPFYGATAELEAFKKRTLTTKPRAARGTDFDNLFYNHWRLTSDLERKVVLCEGESDTWRTHHSVGDEYTVLGIPTGAGDDKEHKEPAQAHLLTNRTVILAFDGDNSGRAARQAWHDALTTYGCTVKFAPVPEGEDMCTVADPKRVIELASTTLIQAPLDIRLKEGEGYIHPAKSENGSDTLLSNWYFDPERELVGDGSQAYEGFIEPGHIESIISSFDLKSKSKTIDWAIRNKRYWGGSDKDSQMVLGLLQAESPFLMAGHMAVIAGLHDNHFVFPSGVIGPDYWKYVPPSYDVNLAPRIHIKEGEWRPDMIHTLRQLHQPAVMDPLLAWLAVAPLRSLLNEFPPLSITGSSGTGKTTLTETVVQFFSGTSIANNLTSTTKHALFAYLGCTNAFPVWFDEYRPGARKDALITLEQILRDAYTGQESSKGGMQKESWAAVTSVAMGSPLIVSGEDAFNETSHTERMVLVVLPMEGRSPDALTEVRSWGETGFPHTYLSWLQQGLTEGTLPIIENRSIGDEDLPPRQRINLGVLDLGWRLLTKFMNDHGETLTSPDFSLIIREAKEAMRHAPIEDALRWCLEENDAMQFIFSYSPPEQPTEKWVCLRVENFVSYIEARAKGIFVLPGGVTAVRRHLMTKYGATEQIIQHFGASKKVLAIDVDKLNWK